MSPRLLPLIALAALLAACGEDDASAPAPSATATATANSGASASVNFDCDGAGQQPPQRSQMAFQKQPSCDPGGQAKQSFSFTETKVCDLGFALDCDRELVVVTGKGISSDQAVLPIQADGTVQGTLELQQQVQDNGLGQVQCFVVTLVFLNGKAHCESTRSLEMTTIVDFQSAQPGVVEPVTARVDGEFPIPDVSPLSSPTPASPPFPEPALSPSPSPSVSPSPSLRLRHRSRPPHPLRLRRRLLHRLLHRPQPARRPRPR